MGNRDPNAQYVIDALMQVAARWRMQEGPDYGPLFVLGAIIHDLTKPKPRRLSPDVQNVIEQARLIAEEWRRLPDHQAPLQILESVILDLHRGRYKPRQARAPDRKRSSSRT